MFVSCLVVSVNQNFHCIPQIYTLVSDVRQPFLRNCLGLLTIPHADCSGLLVVRHVFCVNVTLMRRLFCSNLYFYNGNHWRCMRVRSCCGPVVFVNNDDTADNSSPLLMLGAVVVPGVYTNVHTIYYSLHLFLYCIYHGPGTYCR